MVGLTSAKMLKGHVGDMNSIVGDLTNIEAFNSPRELNKQVVYDHKNCFKVPWPQVLLANINWTFFITIIGGNCIVIYIAMYYNFSMEGTAHGMIGSALFFLLGFRANSCYERYWDGRKLWGTIINTSRDLARQVCCYCPPGAERNRTVAFLAAFAVSVKRNLRQERCLNELSGVLDDQDIVNIQLARHMPLYCLDVISHYMASMFKAGHFDGHMLAVMDAQLSQMQLAQGGCERIRTTSIPLAYTVHLRVLCFLWLVFLPLPLVAETSWYALIPTAMIVYAVLGIDGFSGEIAMPFGNDRNDLPLGLMCEALIVNLREIMVRADHPQRMQAFEMGDKKAWAKFAAYRVQSQNVKLGDIG
jgi:ion channel-forming bestrophin family protein